MLLELRLCGTEQYLKSCTKSTPVDFQKLHIGLGARVCPLAMLGRRATGNAETEADEERRRERGEQKRVFFMAEMISVLK